MDKTAIRNFAIEARKILMKSAIAEAGFYGISKDGVKAPIQKGKDFEVYETLAGTEKRIFGDDIKRRENLANAVKELGFEQVIEETAYTWFNRIIAIRFMEVNNYLPTRVHVLSSETGSSTPDIVTQADTVELNMSVAELESVQQAKQDNKYDEAFRLLFIKQCNELNAILPGLFEKTNDYMELLLKIPYTGDGVIRMLIDTIPEDNFNVETEGQVEIIGWMYQYYNTELKDDTFAKLKKNVKITKERIPAATQLFTPDWIVRYMVENSLGRIWIEHLRAVDPSVDEKSKAEEFGWKYYLPEAEQEENVAAQLVDIRASYKSLTPQDITCIDPCMGSGHILVYMFDVLMDIYRSEGFSEREAVFDILEKNIRGLDIDKRAYQLSYFALMMKARGYNRIFFRGHENLDGERVQAVPQVYAIEESNSVNRNQLKYFGSGMSEIEKNCAINELTGLLDQLMDAKEYGSILSIDTYNWTLLKRFVSNYEFSGQMNLEMVGIDDTAVLLNKLVNQSIVIGNKYCIVVTNPPYFDPSSLRPKVNDYIKKKFPNSKSDLCSVFIEVSLQMLEKHGLASLVTMQSWMFLSSYEKLRKQILENNELKSILHLGMEAFEGIIGKVVTTAAYVIAKHKHIGDGCIPAVRLVDFYDSDRYLKEPEFFNKQNHYQQISQNDVKNIPGMPIAYWIDKAWINVFGKYNTLGSSSQVKRTLQTGDSNRFMRIWFEVEKSKLQLEYLDRDEAIKSNAKWYMFSYGGRFRKWYGNLELVVNWENNGAEIKATGKAIIPSENLYFKETLAWSKVTSNDISVRYYDKGILPGDASACVFDYSGNIHVLLGYMNSTIAREILRMISPSMNFPTGTVAQLPIPDNLKNEELIERLVKRNIELSRIEWNFKETSWEFKKHPIIEFKRDNYQKSYEAWISFYNDLIKEISENEDAINNLFMQEMNIDDEIVSDIDHGTKINVISRREAAISFIMYAVGCMFGRYSLEKEGLISAGSNNDLIDCEKYGYDADNIIPIMDEDYFEDDITCRFVEFVRVVFGKDNFNESLEFIAKSLDETSENSVETIRIYFLKSFYSDHCAMYSNKNLGKRPIYWLFSSGDANGFKCLIYVHRYCQNQLGLMRTDYLNKAQSFIETSLKNAEYIIGTSTSAVDKALAMKKRDKYLKQLQEIKIYYQAISHMALQNIEINLDDGIKDNYNKFQGIELQSEGGKKQTIDLLAKI